MFVILECWSNLPAPLAPKPLPQRVGQALKHAGVAITVTSVTDMLAFGLGALTVIPGLRAFCVTAMLCIGWVFLLQVTTICLLIGCSLLHPSPYYLHI